MTAKEFLRRARSADQSEAEGASAAKQDAPETRGRNDVVTVKAFLRRARGADRLIDQATERVERVRARLESGRMSNLTGMPRGGAADWTETADQLIELEKRVNERVRDMCRLKRLAMDTIDAVEEARLREVLELYYIDGYTWEQVAERMGYSRRNVTTLHGVALRKIKVPEEVKNDEIGRACETAEGHQR